MRECGNNVGAVVSRGGRPAPAAPRLHEVTAPVPLTVGGNDPLVLDLNRDALRRLRAPSDLPIVWFTRHLEPQGMA